MTRAVKFHILVDKPSFSRRCLDYRNPQKIIYKTTVVLFRNGSFLAQYNQKFLTCRFTGLTIVGPVLLVPLAFTLRSTVRILDTSNGVTRASSARALAALATVTWRNL